MIDRVEFWPLVKIKSKKERADEKAKNKLGRAKRQMRPTAPVPPPPFPCHPLSLGNVFSRTFENNASWTDGQTLYRDAWTHLKRFCPSSQPMYLCIGREVVEIESGARIDDGGFREGFDGCVETLDSQRRFERIASAEIDVGANLNATSVP